MNRESLNIVFIGLTITSSWGNGHATTYRGLVRELTRLGHRVAFLEKDVEWYASNRDLPNPPFGATHLYASTADLQSRFASLIRSADLVIIGSYVHDGIAIGEWVLQLAPRATAFYDIDTPVTLAKLRARQCDYLSRELIAGYDLYLSFTGGPTLELLEQEYRSPMARALYCSFDPEIYFPEPTPLKWDLGYMGTYSDDRQPALERLLLEPARHLAAASFVVAGPQYPGSISWPPNVQRIYHLSPREHRQFYCAQRFTLNITRQDMIAAGYSPSVRLFEAAACGTPIISDHWEGLDQIFAPGAEILVAENTQDVARYLQLPESAREEIGHQARARVLAAHTARHRALELVQYARHVLASPETVLA